MEIKLTTDWIFLHNSEVFCKDGKCFFRIYNDDFQYYLTELALKTLNVNYECEELFDESDEDFEKPTYYYSFENIEDIKDSCPELYAEFQKSIESDIQYNRERNLKFDIILKFLDTAKTLNQLHRHLVKEVHIKAEDYELHKSSLPIHTKYLIDDLLGRDLIRKEKNKYIRCVQ